MVHLHSFPNERGHIKIIARASGKFLEIGTELLKDTHGIKVANIQSKTNGNVEAMHEIFCQWLREDTQCSWKKLVQCLRNCDCKPLADEIDNALEKTRKGIFYFVHRSCYIENILLSMQMMAQ